MKVLQDISEPAFPDPFRSWTLAAGGRLILELFRSHEARGRVTPVPIVEYFNPVKYFSLRLFVRPGHTVAPGSRFRLAKNDSAQALS